jgi:hypothetical protein
MSKPTIGRTVRDKVTGFTGIAQAMTEFMTGNVQLGVQPPAKDGSLPESIAMDIHQLEDAPGASVDVIAPPPTHQLPKLGEKFEDIVSGVVGIAVRRTTFINGCVYYTIQSPPTKDGSIIEHFFEWKRLKRVSAGITATLAKTTTPEKTSTRAPGGPNTRIPMRG